MDRKEFLLALDEMLELDPGTLTGDETLESLEAWDSLAVISFIALVDEKTGVAFYRVLLTIKPIELKKLKKGVELTPGMPAMANIVTGERTIMSYLISPITDTWHDAFREE